MLLAFHWNIVMSVASDGSGRVLICSREAMLMSVGFVYDVIIDFCVLTGFQTSEMSMPAVSAKDPSLLR